MVVTKLLHREFKPLNPVFYTLLFFGLSLIGIFYHELWLDESHHWLLARDSDSIVNLYSNMKYEGHPILWNIILYSISRFSHNPFWMQLFHILISTFMVYTFLKKNPFRLLFKILFIFGYFIVYEYTLISRNYSLGILFLFLACSLYQKRKEKFISYALFLGIANNTHAIFIVITCSLICIEILDHFQKQKSLSNLKMNIGLSIFLLTTVIALIQIIPPINTTFFERSEHFTVTQKITRSAITFFKGVFVVPDFRTIHFWNTNLIINLNKPLAALSGLVSFLIPFIIFFKNKFIMLYVYLSILGAILFFFITQLSAPRYFGIYFIILIVGLWIEHYDNDLKNKLSTSFLSQRFMKMKNKIIYTILITQMFSGVVAYGMDLYFPFSGAKQTITYIKERGLDNKTIVTKWCGGTPLSSYLQKPIFFTNSNSYQSFCHWNSNEYSISNSEIDLVNSLDHLIKNNDQSIIFISIHPLKIEEIKSINNSLKYRFHKSYQNNIVSKESYYIYEVSKI